MQSILNPVNNENTKQKQTILGNRKFDETDFEDYKRNWDIKFDRHDSLVSAKYSHFEHLRAEFDQKLLDLDNPHNTKKHNEDDELIQLKDTLRFMSKGHY